MTAANSQYDLAVVYRICPFMSKSAPPVFGGDKFLLSKVALESFKAALGNLRVKLWVLLDNCPPEYEKLFTDLWDARDLVLERHPGIGNRGTLLRQFQIVADQADAELVYLAEDDYVYHPHAFEEMVGFLRDHPEVDFLTPYLHRDIETLSVHQHRQQTLQHGEQTWKTVKTTTGTFATRRTVFRETKWVFDTLLQKVLFSEQSDVGVWLALTKYDIFNLGSWVTWPFKSRYWAWSLFSAWWTCARQIVFGRRYNLWVASPSLCTHLADGLMPTGYDWDKELQVRIAVVKKSLAQV
jgi:hypothetical protein